MTLEVLLIRHAQTPGNLEYRYIGRTDQPLSKEGESAARAAGTMTDEKRVYVSPMIRARRTAELMLPNAEQIALRDLREMDFGDFEGRSADEMANNAAYRRWVESGCEEPCPGGESMESFSARVCASFDEAVRDAIRRGDNRVVIVAHGGVIMAVMAKYGYPKRRYHEWRVPNCGGWRARLDTSAPTELKDIQEIKAIPIEP